MGLRSNFLDNATIFPGPEAMRSKNAIKPHKRPACLLGLTESETAEFEDLCRGTKRPMDEFEARARDARWIELYLKQEVTRLTRTNE
jgi:hypothetical protein